MASGSSSSSFFGIREEDLQNQLKQHQLQQQPPPAMPISSAAAPPAAPPPKKKRNLPGTPNPDAEVIALSPKTLMATNRFICEVCNKGFQREQNLQLHRRGHNLPWKLRQKSTKEVKRRVYLCPEPTCVHHDPSRALGDLTGIKKHFCRKHGEKKWKCDKCSKRYAVQSDWKAHSKTCGTREYRCDCGTLFSRRDSFITHRAFCDALAQESARIPTGLGPIGSHLYGSSSNNSMGLGLSQVSSQLSSLHDHQTPSADLLRLGGGGGGGGGGSGTQFNHLLSAASNPSSSFRPPQPSSGFFLGGQNQDFADESQSHHHSLLHSKAFHGLMLPDLQSSNNNNSNAVSSPAAANLFNLGFFSNSSTASSITNSSSNNNNNNNNGQNSHLLIPDQFNSSNGGTAVQQAAAAMFSGGLMGDHMGGSGVSSIFNASSGNEPVLPQMSATALLQKAAQMGATTTTTSNGGPSLLRAFGSSSSSSTPKTTIFRNPFGDGGGGGGESMRLQLDSEAHFQDLMNSLTNGNANGIFGNNNGGGVSAFGGSNCTGEQENAGFGGGFGGNMSMMDDEAKLHQTLSLGGGGMGGSDRLTRDFLGVGGVVRGMGGGAMSQREQQQQHQRQHHGLDIGSGMKSANDPRSFAGGALQ